MDTHLIELEDTRAPSTTSHIKGLELAGSLAVAVAAFYFLVEKPSHRLARKLGRRCLDIHEARLARLQPLRAGACASSMEVSIDDHQRRRIEQAAP